MLAAVIALVRAMGCITLGLLLVALVAYLAIASEVRRVHNRNARLGWPHPGAVKPYPWWKWW